MSYESSAEKGAIPLRLQLLMLSARASKPALDLTLSCHYSEGWALLRSMLEGWIRTVYVRVLPEQHIRWYAAEDEALGSLPRAREPKWGRAASDIKSRGDDDDRRLIEEAQPRWEDLKIGAHPSGEAITQTRGEGQGMHVFRPS